MLGLPANRLLHATSLSRPRRSLGETMPHAPRELSFARDRSADMAFHATETGGNVRSWLGVTLKRLR